MKKLARFAVWLVCLGACGGGSEEQPMVVDAGRTQPDAYVPDPSLPGLRGTVIDRYLTETGEQQLARDLTMGFDMEILAEQTDGTYVTYPVMGSANGNFAAPDVPDGVPVIVRYGTDYLYTSERRLVYGTVFGRRANAVQAAEDTRIALNVSGLVPTTGFFPMMFLGPQSQYWRLLSLDSTSSDPAVLTATLPFDTDAYLIDGSQGDAFYIMQLGITPLIGGNNYNTIVSVATPEPFTMEAGQITDITTTARNVPQDQSFALEWQEETFDAMRADIFPEDIQVDTQTALLNLFAVPLNAANGASSIAIVELMILFLNNLPDVTAPLMYGDPFPATWERVADLAIGARGVYRNLSDAEVLVFSRSAMSIPLRELVPGPLAFPLSRVRSPLIDSMDALMPLQDVSLQPTVSWEAPEIGEPTSYNVVISRLDEEATIVASLRTADTQVKIPPNVLEAGKRYVVDIRAVWEPGEPLTRPFYQPLTAAVISRLTNTIDTVAP